jgi:integrase
MYFWWEEIPFYDMFADLFKVMLYTGQKKSNVLQMRFRSIDFETRTWLLTPAETKNKEYHAVPLHEDAFNILCRRQEEIGHKSEYVFPSPVYPGKPMLDVRKKWYRLLEEAELENLRIHDIRRSLGAMLLMSDTDLKTVSKILGHKDSAVTDKVYTPILQGHKRQALDRAFKSVAIDEASQIPFEESKKA